MASAWGLAYSGGRYGPRVVRWSRGLLLVLRLHHGGQRGGLARVPVLLGLLLTLHQGGQRTQTLAMLRRAMRMLRLHQRGLPLLRRAILMLRLHQRKLRLVLAPLGAVAGWSRLHGYALRYAAAAGGLPMLLMGGRCCYY